MANTHTDGPPFGGLLRGAPHGRGGGGRRGGGGVWLSKKWLAPLFRGFHSSLAPTARPGSYAEKPLLRKAFCGFAVHAAKSDYSLRGLRPPNPQGFFDRLKRERRQSLRLPLFRARSAPPPPRRAPNGNLLPRAGVHPSAIRRLPWGRRKAGADMRGAAAFWGRGLWPRPQNMPAAGQSPAADGWAAPTRRRLPRRWDFHQRQKRQRKSQAPRLPGPGTRNVGRKVRGNGSTPRAKPLPTPYGQRRLKPPRRGLRTPGNRARCCATLAVRVGPPPAQGRRARSTAVRVAQGG